MGESLSPQAREAKLDELRLKMVKSVSTEQLGNSSGAEPPVKIFFDEKALAPDELQFWQEEKAREKAEKERKRAEAAESAPASVVDKPRLSLEEERALRDAEITQEVLEKLEESLREHDESGAEVFLQNLVSGKNYADLNTAVDDLKRMLIKYRTVEIDHNNPPLVTNPVFNVRLRVAGQVTPVKIQLSISHYQKISEVGGVQVV